MGKKSINIRDTMRWVVRALVLVVVIIILWWLLFADKDNRLGTNVNDSINVTPQQIQSIRQIGEWEFLSVSNEELVDTVRKGLFGDDQLVRIYYGTLRLGIDMRKLKDGWIKASGDTVVMTVPKVGLLDNDFIDEARTKAFYESGKWSPRDREALYHKARRQMLVHGLTPSNLRSAQDNADAQMRRMMKAMGYNNIVVRFED